MKSARPVGNRAIHAKKSRASKTDQISDHVVLGTSVRRQQRRPLGRYEGKQNLKLGT